LSSQEDKNEALVILLMLVVVWSATRFVLALDGGASAAADRHAALWRAGLCYVVSGIALVYSHSIGPVGIIIVNLGFLACLVGLTRPVRAVVLWGLANLLIVVAFAPLLSAMLAVSAQRIGYYWLPPPPSLATALRHLRGLTNESFRLPGIFGAALPILCVLAAAGGFLGCLWRRWTEGDRTALLFAAAMAASPIVLFVLSHTVTSIFLAHILIALTLPVMIPMIALGFEALQPAALRLSAAALVAAAYLVGNLAPTEPREPWNEVAHYVTERATPRDVLLFWPPYAQWGMDFYMQQPASDQEYLLDLGLHSEFLPFRTLPFIDPAAAARLLATADHAWIILDEKDMQASVAIEHIDAMLAQLPGWSARTQHFALGLLVLEVSSSARDGRR
jgi:hypothetical protein